MDIEGEGYLMQWDNNRLSVGLDICQHDRMSINAATDAYRRAMKEYRRMLEYLSAMGLESRPHQLQICIPLPFQKTAYQSQSLTTSRPVMSMYLAHLH